MIAPTSPTPSENDPTNQVKNLIMHITTLHQHNDALKFENALGREKIAALMRINLELLMHLQDVRKALNKIFGGLGIAAVLIVGAGGLTYQELKSIKEKQGLEKQALVEKIRELENENAELIKQLKVIQE